MLQPTSNKTIRVAAVVVALSMLTSCDFFRSLAGRPTSSELESMKTPCCCECSDSCCKDSCCCCAVTDTAAVADTLCCKDTCCVACTDTSCTTCCKDSCCHTCCKDTCHCGADAPQAVAEDSVKQAIEGLIADIKAAQDEIYVPEYKCYTLGTKVSVPVKGEYYVLVGTFADKANAKSLQSRAARKGYEAELLPYVNGLTGVGLCPSATIEEAKSALCKVSSESFCPKDVCIIRIKK